jgi:hypothetical protein
VDTRAGYPVNAAALPAGVQPFLEPQLGFIQSDAPEIAALAAQLAQGSASQVQAADRILTWVRAHITYDYTFSLPNDALSVLHNRSGVCAGFSSLTVALLRAAGLPARYQLGCVAPWGWMTGPEGGWHAWVEVYYPDVGWIASDPQTTSHFIDTAHFVNGFGACGQASTVITRTSHSETGGQLYTNRVSEPNAAVWSWLSAAHIPAWDRHPLRVTPPQPGLMRPISEPVGAWTLQVENRECWNQQWQLQTDAAWLTPAVVTGTAPGAVTLVVDGAGLPPGEHTAEIRLLATSWAWPGSGVLSRTVSARLWLVDELFSLWLPSVKR